eukprot:7577826-Pyramimonas_sp.AAC.1
MLLSTVAEDVSSSGVPWATAERRDLRRLRALLHIGIPGTRGRAVGLRPHGDSQQMLVYDSRQDVVMQIGDEALFDLVTHWDEG